MNTGYFGVISMGNFVVKSMGHFGVMSIVNFKVMSMGHL